MAKKKPKDKCGEPVIYGQCLSWSELLEQAANRPAFKTDSDASSMCVGDPTWSGTNTFSDAMELARLGWPEGAAAMRDVDALAAGVDHGTGWKLDHAGAFPLVPAYLSGDMECMLQQADDAAEQQRITLVITASVASSVESDTLRRYGIALAALVRSLDACGIATRIVSLYAGRDGTGQRYSSCVVAHDYGAPLDLDRIAFLGHAAYMRRVLFAIREMSPTFKPVATGLYGYTIPLAPEYAVELTGDADSSMVLLPRPSEVEHSSSADILARFRSACSAC